MPYRKPVFAVSVMSMFLAVQAASATILINEIDADSVVSLDAAEFIELFSSSPSTSLDGLVIVMFNGTDDASYAAIDLDGHATDAQGYFVIGDPGVPNVDLSPSGWGNSSNIQNGPDAIALYTADASDFPDNSAMTTSDLIDAIVYGSGPADTALINGLTPGESQIDEAGGGDLFDRASNSMSRLPNGSGGTPDSSAWTSLKPTPGAANPEPTSLALLSLGGLAVLRRRR